MRFLCLWSLLLPLALAAGEEPLPLEALPEEVVLSSLPESMPETPEAGSQSAPFPPYLARYEVRYDGFKVGELTQQLEAMVEGRQALQTVAYTTGVVAWFKSDRISERSVWLSEAGRLLPQSYRYHYTGRSKEIVERHDFDWRKQEVQIERDGAIRQMALEPGAMDKHMYQVALRHDLLSGLKQASYAVVERDRLEPYEFEVLGEERLELPPFGPLDCLKVKKGTTRIWVAHRFDFLPVKIEKEEDGATIGTYLIELQGG
ncbi:MAG: DUF3108 domain-containing protein [Gammaproteobacteria bacterium]|nr:DUF3108 domain-containing protein [Gammaproteobacteria bacterium]